MKVLVYAADPVGSEARKCFPGQVELEILSLSSLNRTLERRRADRFVYLDASKLDGPDFDDMAAAFSRREGLAWGVLDLEGVVKDPALLFFLGAADYLGPGVLPVDEERLRKALSRAHRDDEAPETEQPRSFPGWARLHEGKEYSFLFCHAALGEQERLRDAIGEKRFAKLKEAFASHVAEIAAGLDGKAWIQDPTGLLLAFPPKPALDSPVLAAFELLLDRALVGYEIFHLEVPATFRFAFHSGKAPWRPPGATGTVVSDDVNFIFHLATRYPHDGRIVVSSACSDAIPQQIADLFTPAPAFEGRDLSLSRRFCD